MASKPKLGRFHLYEYLVIIEPHKRESGDVVDDYYYNDDDDGDDARYYCNGRPTQHSCPGRDSNPGTREKRDISSTLQRLSVLSSLLALIMFLSTK
jgi:hypothetical protein